MLEEQREGPVLPPPKKKNVVAKNDEPMRPLQPQDAEGWLRRGRAPQIKKLQKQFGSRGKVEIPEDGARSATQLSSII